MESAWRGGLQEASERSLIRKPFQAIRFEGRSNAPAEAVYDLLANLQSHLEWAGAKQLETTRLLSMEAPAGPATVGTEFVTTGSDGKVARFADRSVITEAIRPAVFEFVTESLRQGKPGSRPWHLTMVHHYEIEPDSGGCRVIYTEEITRISGAPRAFAMPGIRRFIYRIASRYMRRGFDALIATAEEQTAVQ
jgi:Polyketide cyclase / dehydrase and lipid transport